MNYIITIQRYIRGFIYRKNNLPNSILYIQKILTDEEIKCSSLTSDGRTNSCLDENQIIDILKKYLNNSLIRILKPDKRHWFDFIIYDYQYGYLPINIKSTTTKNSDNTGNLTMCVYALTNEKLNLFNSYNNGKMSELLIKKIKNKNLNLKYKKDYYFVVINKLNTKEIICNSFKGLQELTPNINNLPFQVKWSNNKIFTYKPITEVLNQFIISQKKPNPSWSEIYLNEIRNI